MTSPSPDELRRKKIRAWSVLLCAAVFLGAGLAAAFLAFAPRLRTPSLHARRAPEPLPSLEGPPIGAPRIAWRPWGAAAFREAERAGRLVLLDVHAGWSHWSLLMDARTYSDPAVAAWIERNVVPVRVERDERPDLARRYGPSIPATALLLPTGEALSTGAYVPPDRFLPWAERVLVSRRKAGREIEAARLAAWKDAAARREELLGPGRDASWSSLAEPERRSRIETILRSGLRAAADALEAEPRFPPFDAIALWREASSAELPEPARSAARVQLERALDGLARLEDPAEGGVYRYSRCADWSCPEYEKVLAVQAGTIEAASRAGGPRAALAARTADFVERRLRLAAGRYAYALGAAARGPSGWMDGARYYALDAAARARSGFAPERSAGAYAAAHAELAQAYLSASGPLDRADLRAAAASALAALVRAQASDGGLAHRVGGGGERGFLEDQVAGADAWTSAGELGRARAALAFARSRLRDPATGGLRVRLPADPPAPGWEEPVDVDGTARAALAADALARRSGALSDVREARAALEWVLARADAVDPVLAARVALRAAAR